MLARLIAALRRLLRLLGLIDSRVPAGASGAPVSPRLGEPELTRPGPPPPPPPPAPPVQATLALPQLVDVAGAFPMRTGDGPSGFTLGMIHSVAGAPTAYGAPSANGRELPIAQNQPLMAVLGFSFGGDGVNLQLPNLHARTPVGGDTIGMFGPQSLTMTYLIATEAASGAPVLGMVVPFGGNYAPPGWAVADGTMLPISANVPLYQTIGQTFGGNPVAFNLPNLDRLAVVGAGQGPGLPPVAFGGHSAQPIPALGLNYLINASGPPAPDGGNGAFPQFGSCLGHVIAFAGAATPAGWLVCDGSLLEPGQYPALFELIGTTYGGDGQASFALPDLRGRVMTGA